MGRIRTGQEVGPCPGHLTRDRLFPIYVRCFTKKVAGTFDYSQMIQFTKRRISILRRWPAQTIKGPDLLTPEDLIHLPYTPDLTRAGIAYACRSLAYTYNRMGGSQAERLRRIVAGKAVELAFRRHINAQGVPHDNLGATAFTDPDHYDVAIGGRRCDLKSFQFFRKERIRRLRADPGLLLQAAALVPRDQMDSERLADKDLYIFAFLTGLVTAQRPDLERAIRAGQPVHLLVPMPEPWVHPTPWASLGQLALKTAAAQSLPLEIGGQAAGKSFQTEILTLAPGQRSVVQGDFYTLAYLHTPQLPDGDLGIHSPVLQQTHIIHPEDWVNIWVYGMRIILAGYITRAEFLRRAKRLPVGSRVLQYTQTRTENYALPVSELRPLAELFEKARRWGR